MNRVDGAGSGCSTAAWRRRGIVRALEAMRLQLADPMSLEYLAKVAAMSRFHFERVFHEVTGLPPFQFLAAMRLVRARELVLKSDAPITAICFDVGYTSVGTFTRRFTASVGISPRRLRRFSQGGQALRAIQELRAIDDAAAYQRVPDRGADIVVHCRGGAEDTRVFVGVFPSPVPIGRPMACAAATGTDTMVLRDVPPGSHYVLGAARPMSTAASGAESVETVVGIAYPAPVRIDGVSQNEVTMQLRPVEVTDPPVVSFLPLLFHESCMRSRSVCDGDGDVRMPPGLPASGLALVK